MPINVFVSHASHDAYFAGLLRDRLVLTYGVVAWCDQYDMRSGPIRQTLLDRIAEYPHFVLLLSPAALASRWVAAEVREALRLHNEVSGRGRQILPVVVSRCEPLGLERKPWIHLRAFLRVESEEAPLSPLPRDVAILQTAFYLGLLPAGTPRPRARFPTALPNMLLTTGREQLNKGEYTDAYATLRGVTEQTPETLEGWFYYSQACTGYAAALGERAPAAELRAEALDAILRALDIEFNYRRAGIPIAPEFERVSEARLWFWQGQALHALTRYPEAQAAYQRSLAADARFTPSLAGSARTLMALRECQHALEAVDVARAIMGPNYSKYNDLRAEILRCLAEDAPPKQ
ncbi:MAG TPA: TIR domain-containing protein [Ktedonobacterales bacterium]|nr:TIR domain-containing protein [Ktedonobacterales bacterium]